MEHSWTVDDCGFSEQIADFLLLPCPNFPTSLLHEDSDKMSGSSIAVVVGVDDVCVEQQSRGAEVVPC